MAKKKKADFEKKIQIVNTVVVVLILGIYIFRLFYYRAKITQPQDVSGFTTLTEVVTDFTNEDLSKEDRLYKNKDGTYTFVGKDVNNYVKYSNMIFRIVSVDLEGNVKIVSEDSIGLSTLSEKGDFINTSLHSFLNVVNGDEKSGIVEKSLYKYTAFRAFGSQIGLLDIDDYKNSNSQSGFINNGKPFWIASQDSQGNYYFIDEEGNVVANYSELLVLPIRITINIKYSAGLISGSGRANDPYILNIEEPKLMSDVGTGAYVKYSDKMWRVINNNGIYGLDYDCDDTMSYDYIDSFAMKRGIYSSLNDNYLHSLNDYEKYLVLNIWNNGSFGETHTYKDCLKEEYEAYVSLASLSTMFIDNDGNYLIPCVDDYSNDYIYSIKDKAIYGISLKDKVNVKPVVFFNPSVLILGGEGTVDSPYIIEETIDEK